MSHEMATRPPRSWPPKGHPDFPSRRACSAQCHRLYLSSLRSTTLHAYQEIIKGTFGDFRGFSEVLRKSIPLLLCGVGLVLAFKAQFWNIGAEGQILAGAVAASGVALFSHLPSP
ncbi:MAG: hypothetical protein R2865_11070 [Deinococcales bacterium]